MEALVQSVPLETFRSVGFSMAYDALGEILLPRILAIYLFYLLSSLLSKYGSQPYSPTISLPVPSSFKDIKALMNLFEQVEQLESQ